MNRNWTPWYINTSAC